MYIVVSIYLRVYKTISLYIYILLQYHFFYIQRSPITSVGFVLPHFWSHLKRHKPSSPWPDDDSEEDDSEEESGMKGMMQGGAGVGPRRPLSGRFGKTDQSDQDQIDRS